MSQDDHSLDWDPGKAWLDSFEQDINAVKKKKSQIYLAWKLFELGFVMISSRREGGLTAYFMSLLKLSLLGSGGRGYCVIWHLSVIFPCFFFDGFP